MYSCAMLYEWKLRVAPCFKRLGCPKTDISRERIAYDRTFTDQLIHGVRAASPFTWLTKQWSEEGYTGCLRNKKNFIFNFSIINHQYRKKLWDWIIYGIDYEYPRYTGIEVKIKIKLIIRTMFSLEVIQFSGNYMYFSFFFIFRFLIYNFNRKNNCLIKSKFYEIWFVVNMRL